MTTASSQTTSTGDSMSHISNIASVTDALTEVLADTYRLVLKSHIYHWNVTGPLFVPLHDMTEEHYTDMFTAADVLAERIRALGKPATISPARLGQKGADASLAADAMIRDLLSDHENLAARLRALVGTAEAADDPVTADLATARADFHEKAAWMLRAMAA
jgi:starvation-inducible DNA-binding protein